MQHVVDAAARPACHGDVGEVALEELHVREVRQVLALAGDQAVHDADGLAATGQFFTEMRSDETCAAGNEIVSHFKVRKFCGISEAPSTG